jgi:beta-N-acetylhexosaminidase
LHKRDKEKEKHVNGSNSSVNGSSNGVTAGGGGVSSPVISPSVGEYATLMQGLILLGIKQVRKSGADAVMLDCVRFFLSSVLGLMNTDGNIG